MAEPLYFAYTSTSGAFVADVAAERSFKTNCLALMDEVQAKRETVAITKHGKPVAKLVQ
jgi:antitoxin (DNA-binding transcriptional repressor) of toxin-antitoxin stability system